MTEPGRFNVGDDGPFREHVRRLAEYLGADWIDELRRFPNIQTLEGLSRGSSEGAMFLRGLRAHAMSVDEPQTVRDRDDPQVRLALGWIALVFDLVGKLNGGEAIRAEVRNLARAWQFERMFDRLFEAEAAVHWSQSGGVSGIRFSSEAHPDFWSDLVATGLAIPCPHECKRIQPRVMEDQGTDDVARELEETTRSSLGALGPMKATVFLHQRAENVHIAKLRADFAEVATLAAADVSGKWRTRCNREGGYQISVAIAREFQDMLPRKIALPDIPARPVLRTAIETVYKGEAVDPVRLKYAISVRSDVLPRRIGAFERNLYAALCQMPKSGGGVPGIVNLRLRPPRDLGDLYEADAIVRRVLATPRGASIALVCLFWNEGEREEGATFSIGDLPAREVTALWHLRAHYIASKQGFFDFSQIDSGAQRFPPVDGILIRDPGTGGISPVSLEVLELLEAPVDVDVMRSPNESGPHTASIYFELEAPFRMTNNQAIRALRVAGRAFLTSFAEDLCFRVIEFVDREPIRVATIDLRAWIGESEFLFTILCGNDDWSLRADHPDEVTQVEVRSVAIPRAFL